MSTLKGFNPFESEINCLHPQIILNPKFAELVAVFGNYTLKGNTNHVRFTSFQVHHFNCSHFNPNYLDLKLKDVEDCYITDYDTGVIYPMYLILPCGKCFICSESKASNFVRRCQYESQCYDCYPVHITLTYDEQHIPFDRSVSLRHIQLWKKRFRQYLDRLMYNRNIRICVAAEYGTKNTRRPHYHVLVWNLKETEVFSYETLRGLAWRAWYDENDLSETPMCHYRRLTFLPVTADYKPKGCRMTLRQMGKSNLQAFSYVAKYFYKSDESSVPPGCKPLFHTMSKSKGVGGIGAPFLLKHKDEMRRLMKKEYLFSDRFSGSLFTVSYDRYVLDYVFPSKYKSVSYKFRKSLNLLFRYGKLVQDVILDPRYCELLEKSSRLYPVFVLEHPNPRWCFRVKRHCDLIGAFYPYLVREALSYCYDYIRDLDIDEVLKVDQLRSVLLGKLFQVKKKMNVARRVDSIKTYRSRRKQEFVQL